MTAKCLWCGRTLVYEPGKGWQHGNGIYWMRCTSCGAEFSSGDARDFRCPRCGSGEIIDDHAAMPSPG